MAITRSAVFATLWLLLLVSPAAAAPPSQPDLLIARARSMGLASERNWHILLHYKKTYGGGFRSRISDPNFFLSPQGRENPEAELEATIAGFFLPRTGDGEHPICRFPARLQWLKDRLGISPGDLPETACTEQKELLQTVDARSAVLVFPVGHINSPASMFGHTLLRFDGPTKSNLISFAVNYAADANDKNGLLYAYKGLCGKYKGYYSLMPYYLKVKEYGDLEHRDMWEYRLRLSQEEVDRMLLHTLELERISSQYFFLDENCSFNLLFLIEAARPTLHLSDRTGLWVLPTDTIELARENGIVDEAVYRPSQGARIVKMASLLDAEGQKAALKLAQGKSEPSEAARAGASVQQQREVLDLAAEMVQLRYARKELEKDDFNKLYLKILAQRSRMGKGEDDLYTVAPPPPPDAGHGTVKLGAGGGVRRNEWFGELRLQPAFHDMLDPDQGYIRGAQIKFLDTALRYAPEHDRLWLKSLHLLDIASTSPRDRFFTPLSWKAAAGWDTEAMKDGGDSLIFRVNTGGGFAARSPFGGILHALGEVDLNAGRRFAGNVAAGPGVSLGALEQLTDWWKLQLKGEAFYYLLGDERVAVKGTVAQNFRLTRNDSVNLELSYQEVEGHSVREATLLWNRYF
ncbi:Lnb N-terminal periplasmic domain-containing protein [Geoanaerobacter pelophilus]|nr:DUF4105 domain-containing protein [Geoanaerobacter pelophilus]